MAVQGCHSFESNDDAGLPHRVSACEFRHLAAAFSIYPLRGPLKTLPGLPVATRLLSRVGWRHPYFFLLALYLFHRRLAAEHGRNARAWPKAALSQRTRPPSRRHLGTRTASYNHFFPPFFFSFSKWNTPMTMNYVVAWPSIDWSLLPCSSANTAIIIHVLVDDCWPDLVNWSSPSRLHARCTTFVIDKNREHENSKIVKKNQNQGP